MVCTGAEMRDKDYTPHENWCDTQNNISERCNCMASGYIDQIESLRAEYSSHIGSDFDEHYKEQLLAEVERLQMSNKQLEAIIESKDLQLTNAEYKRNMETSKLLARLEEALYTIASYKGIPMEERDEWVSKELK